VRSWSRPVALAAMAAVSVLATATAWTATLSWRVLALDPGTWLRPSIVLAVVVVSIGIAGRAVRWSAPLIALVQLLAGLGTVSWQLVGSPVPVGPRASELLDQVTHALDLSTRVKPPAPVDGGVLPLLLLGTLISVIAVDLVVLGLRGPAVAGPLLVAGWAVAVWNGPVHLPWWSLALPAAGFCLLLVVSQVIDRLSAAADPDSPVRAESASSLPVLARATAIGATAIVAAVVVPHIVSTGGLDLLPSGGGGGGGQNETLTVTNPMVSLKRDLVQGPDYDLLTVHTDDPDPAYLRISVLTTFRDNAWTAGERTVPSANRADGEVPLPQGIGADVTGSSHYYDITASDHFSSRWLPTQPPVSTIVAQGDWRYDTGTMDFLAAKKGLTTKGLSWTMTGFQPDFTVDYLDSLSSTAFSSPTYTALPGDLAPSVTALAREVTAAADSPFAKAVALQSWFRTDGGFVYDTSTDLGDGADDLTTFLGTGPRSRQGYCQQFATAMAVMARTLGIPARVAVGFLRPDHVEGDTWVYSAHDLHAWPELYFQGAGWVRFEPTPASRATDVPDYTDSSSLPSPGQTPTTVPSRRPSAAPSTTPSRRPAQDQSTDSGTSNGSALSSTLSSTVPFVAAGLLVIAALFGPALVRRQRRRSRLSRATPEDLWAELRDTAVDLGAPWPEDDSVRRQAAGLRVEGPGADALTRLRTGVEESRYAAIAVTTADAEDLTTVTASLWSAAGPRTKRRARLWPRSLRRRRR